MDTVKFSKRKHEMKADKALSFNRFCLSSIEYCFMREVRMWVLKGVKMCAMVSNIYYLSVIR